MKIFFRVILSITLLSSCSSDSDNDDLIPPTISFELPSDRLGAKFNVDVDAEDNNEVAKVEIFINNDRIASDPQPPFFFVVNLQDKEPGTYQFKAVATDGSGNKAEKSQSFILDNSIPVISEVNFNQDEVIGGENNTLRFKVRDNDQISEIKVLFNNLVIADLEGVESNDNPDFIYEVVMDKSIVPDGTGTLEIEATDLVNNTANSTIEITVDNTGPMLETENIFENVSIGEKITVEPLITDNYSLPVNLKVFLDDILLFEGNTQDNVTFEIDPTVYGIQKSKIRFDLKDNLGNASIVEYNVNFVEILATIRVPDGYFSETSYSDLWLIVSDTNGKLMHSIKASENKDINLFSSVDFNLGIDQYSITFLNRFSGGSFNIETIQNIDSNSLQFFNLPKRPQPVFSYLTKNIPMVGFPENSYAIGKGYGYFAGEANGENNFQILLSDYPLEEPEYAYIAVSGFPTPSSVRWIKYRTSELADLSELNSNNLLSEKISTRLIDNPGNQVSLNVFGYENKNDLDNDISHTVQFPTAKYINNQYEYRIIDDFDFYRYQYTITYNDYFVTLNKIGLPDTAVEVPEWSFDYSVENDGIFFTKSGQGFDNGDIFISDSKNGTAYVWRFSFDGELTSKIVFPELPEDPNLTLLANLPKNDFNTLNVSLFDYDEVQGYQDYILRAKRNFKPYYLFSTGYSQFTKSNNSF
ncbi:Ig-like domain-containing protein [Flavobacteriaceae bacterium M23B6Z8]